MTDASRLPHTTLPLLTLLRRTLVPLAIAALLLLAPISLLPTAAGAAPAPQAAEAAKTASKTATTPAPTVTPPTIVPFGDWAPAACPAPTGEDPAEVHRVVVHHTYQPVATTPDEVLPALALTCKAHTDRGFSTIGYHYVVSPWGEIYQGRGAMPDKNGNPPETQAQGAHVAGSNSGAVGIVFLGNHEEAPPTSAALESATHLAAWLMEGTGHDPSARIPAVSTGAGTARFTGSFEPQALNGHSDSNHTECPGNGVRIILDPMRDRVRQLMAGQEAASWAGLAVDTSEHEVVAAEPAPVEAKPAGKPAIRKAPPATDQAPATAEKATPEAAANGAARARPRLESGSPLVSTAEKLSGALDGAGLGSLADRFGPAD